jgi:hypothetical protein
MTTTRMSIIHPEAIFVEAGVFLQIVTVIIVVRLAFCRTKLSKNASDSFLRCIFLYFSQFGDSLVLEKVRVRLSWFVGVAFFCGTDAQLFFNLSHCRF